VTLSLEIGEHLAIIFQIFEMSACDGKLTREISLQIAGLANL